MKGTEDESTDSLSLQFQLNDKSPRHPSGASIHSNVSELTKQLIRIQDLKAECVVATAPDNGATGGNTDRLAISLSDTPLEARELDTLVRLTDPSTGQFIAFDRETGWWDRFPTASRADAAMLTHFYAKLSSRHSKYIQHPVPNHAAIPRAILGRKKQ